jgi:hypothetical protein
MATPRVVNGARVKVLIQKAGEAPKVIGIFNNLSYQVALDVQPAFILGRYSAASLDYTAMEPVNITARGWRVVGQGAHEAAAVPRLQEMLTAEPIIFQVFDRLTNQNIATITNVRASGHSNEFAARQQSELPVSFLGLIPSDESDEVQQHETDGATDLPQT